MKIILRLLLIFVTVWAAGMGPAGSAVCRAQDEPEAAPVSTQTARTESEKLADTEKIDPGDVLDLFVYPQAELNSKLPVLEDGTVAVPTVGRVKVAGLTQKEAIAIFKKEISRYFVNAKISLGVIKFNRRFVLVTGMVGRTGQVDYREGMTLTEVIAQASGFNRDADRKNVRVFRGEPGHRQVTVVNVAEIVEQGNMGHDYPIQMGDLVEVPVRRDIVFIWGDIGSSGAVDYLPEMKLYDLVVRAGGLSHFAKTNEVRIFHLDGSLELVDFSAVLRGDPSKNVLIRPGDIVYIPHYTFARATEWISLIAPWFSIIGTILTLIVLLRQ